jgi:hypothetical protein
MGIVLSQTNDTFLVEWGYDADAKLFGVVLSNDRDAMLTYCGITNEAAEAVKNCMAEEGVFKAFNLLKRHARLASSEPWVVEFGVVPARPHRVARPEVAARAQHAALTSL